MCTHLDADICTYVGIPVCVCIFHCMLLQLLLICIYKNNDILYLFIFLKDLDPGAQFQMLKGASIVKVWGH